MILNCWFLFISIFHLNFALNSGKLLQSQISYSNVPVQIFRRHLTCLNIIVHWGQGGMLASLRCCKELGEFSLSSSHLFSVLDWQTVDKREGDKNQSKPHVA